MMLNSNPVTKRLVRLFLLALPLLLAGAATGSPTVHWLGYNVPLSLSADGSVVAGNTYDGNYETFRWTEVSGLVTLGAHTGSLGIGAGTPDISDDGLRISATILSPDSTATTQGIWVKGKGWHHTMPPAPADGGVLDRKYGSAYGISGDGNTLVGLYWRPGHTEGGSAHANTWTLDDSTFTGLPSPVRSCRANDTNYDGTVVVGWSEKENGVWQPTVWENGGVEVIAPTDAFTEVKGVSNDGNTLWGHAINTATSTVEAAVWLRTPEGWQENILGALPGTFPGYGKAICRDMTEDGTLAVGYNKFTNGSDSGFVWTLSEGMVSANDYLAARGVVLPENYLAADLTSISHDGRVMCGYGYDTTVYPYHLQGFVIELDDASPVADTPGIHGLVFESNYPNPFNPSTTLALSLERPMEVAVDVFDARGRLVRTLHRGPLAAGRNELHWDGRDNRGQQSPSGVYFSRAAANNQTVRSQRMMLVK